MRINDNIQTGIEYRSSLLFKRFYAVGSAWLGQGLCKSNPQALWRLLNHTADRGGNQGEKSKVSPLPVSPYYTMPDYNQGHYLMYTDPALCGPLTNSGCTYTSCFTSVVTLEVKVEWSSDLRVEQCSEIEVEQSSNPKSRAEWSSDQLECETGHPLTSPVECIYAPYKVNPNIFQFCFDFPDIFHHTSMHPLFCNIYEFYLIFYDFI